MRRCRQAEGGRGARAVWAQLRVEEDCIWSPEERQKKRGQKDSKRPMNSSVCVWQASPILFGGGGGFFFFFFWWLVLETPQARLLCPARFSAGLLDFFFLIIVWFWAVTRLFFPDVSPHLFIHGEFGFTLYQNCMLPPLTVSLSRRLCWVCLTLSVSVFLWAPLAW